MCLSCLLILSMPFSLNCCLDFLFAAPRDGDESKKIFPLVMRLNCYVRINCEDDLFLLLA